MKNIYKILAFVSCLAFFGQCAPDGEYDHPIVYDNIPTVPILFIGGTTFGANPYYVVPFSGGTGAININIAVPENSPLKIKEITKVVAGATSITPGNVASATVASYIAAPLAVNGNSITFSTSLTEWNSKVAASARVSQAQVDAAATSATPYVERAFLFLVTLEDGSTIISEQCRIRVVK